MADRWISRFPTNRWAIAMVGITAGLTLMFVLTSPRESKFTTAAEALQGE